MGNCLNSQAHEGGATSTILIDSNQKTDRIFDQVELQCPASVLKLCGIIKTYGQRQKERIVGRGIFIQRSIILTTICNIINSQKQQYKRLKCVSSFNGKEYGVQQISMDYKYLRKASICQEWNYCFLRLYDPVELDLECLLGMDYLKYPQGAFIPKVTIKTEENIEFKLERLNVCYQDSENSCLLSGKFNEDNDGGPILTKLDEQWCVIGIQLGPNIARRISKDLFQPFINWTKYNEKKSIRFFSFKGNHHFTLQDQWERYYQQIKTKQKQKKYTQEDALQNFRKRMTAPLQIVYLFRNIAHIKVNGLKLFFERQTQKTPNYEKVLQLSSQYQAHKSAPLNLSSNGFTIRLDLYLRDVIKSSEQKRQFQEVLNMVNEDRFDPSKVDPEYMKILRAWVGQYKVRPFTLKISKKRSILHQIQWKIHQQTTINDLLEQIKKKFAYSFQQFQVFTSNRLYGKGQYDSLIFDADEINFNILDLESYVDAMSKVWATFDPQQIQVKKMVLGDLEHMKEVVYLLSSKEEHGLIRPQRVSHFSIKRGIKNYYVVVFNFKNKLCELVCTKDTLLKKDNGRWVRVQDIHIHDKIIGYNEEYKSTGIYTVIDVIDNAQDQSKAFYSLSINNAHTFYVNNILVHNQNQIRIKVVDLRKKKLEADLQASKSDQICKYFQGLQVYLGSFLLNNKLTFGDYGINNETCLFIYPRGERLSILEHATLKDVYVTSWRLSTTRFSKSFFEEIQKWKQQYYGVHNGRILPLNDIIFTHLKIQKDYQIVIEERCYLQRIKYFEKLESCVKHRQYFVNRFSWKFKNEFFKEIAKNNKYLKQNEILPLYMYSQKEYQHVNQYLLNSDNNEQQLNDDLVFSALLCDSLNKLPSFGRQKTVYRAVSLPNSQSYILNFQRTSLCFQNQCNFIFYL